MLQPEVHRVVEEQSRHLPSAGAQPVRRYCAVPALQPRDHVSQRFPASARPNIPEKQGRPE